jgi:hypothetical protein
MTASFEIDYKKSTIFLEKAAQRKFLSLAVKERQLVKTINNVRIFKTIQCYKIDKRIVIVNLIKILGSDGVYYSEIEYIPEYHVYEVFNQI